MVSAVRNKLDFTGVYLVASPNCFQKVATYGYMVLACFGLGKSICAVNILLHSLEVDLI